MLGLTYLIVIIVVDLVDYIYSIKFLVLVEREREKEREKHTYNGKCMVYFCLGQEITTNIVP